MDQIVNFAGFECIVQVLEYANGGPCLRLVDRYDQGPVATATSWIPDLLPGEIAVKDYSENTGMLGTLIAAGVITEPHRMQDGFPVSFIVPVTAPVE